MFRWFVFIRSDKGVSSSIGSFSPAFRRLMRTELLGVTQSSSSGQSPSSFVGMLRLVFPVPISHLFVDDSRCS